ncbi:hypothetical protein FRC17_003934 [Serendipita sp. 399]|nr:hypothetical protein FRC17_003934 [Serendipita sp. 399]
MEKTLSMKSGLSMRRVDSNVSAMSFLTNIGYDPDDPRITGELKQHRMDPLTSHREAELLVSLLTEALMKFGAPSHRVESQLLSIASSLRLKLQVIHVPGLTFLSFSKHLKRSSAVNIQFIKSTTKIDLGRLHEVHGLYKRLVHYQESAKEAISEIKSLLKRDPIYRQGLFHPLTFCPNAETATSVPEQILIAIICGFILSPMAYNGSVLDLLAAGFSCGIVSWLHLWAAKRSQVFSNVVEITSAIFIAFFARGLSSMPQGIFCYSAIAFTGLVKLLPKYLIICGSLEMASKQFMSGSVKMVYAIIWTLFLGFAITLGSDFYYMADPSARHRRFRATQFLDEALRLRGAFFMHSSNVTGSFHFTNMTTPAASRDYNVRGCYRAPEWPWYLQSPPPWTLVFLVPLYGVFSALASFQPFWDRELFVMVVKLGIEQN